MAVILLPLNLLLFILLIRGWLISRGQFINWIQVTLLGATAFGLWIIFITEFLSLFKALCFYPLAGSWGILFFVLLALNFYYQNNLRAGFEWPAFSVFQLVLIAIIGFFILTTAAIGVMSVPNNWDSMTYHLPRVMYWGQNQSLAHYATFFLPQLYAPIWSEVAITQFYLLTAGDRLFFVVQWASMLGCVLGVSYIARLLGAGLTGQLLAGVVAATIPMGVLQAVTTQNDYVTAFWLVCTVVFMVSFQQTEYKLYMWAMAGSVALATSTKGTAYFYVAPLLIWVAIDYFRKNRGQVWQVVAAVGLLMILVNGMYYWRNTLLFGWPLPSGHDSYNYAVQTFSVPTIISNLLRNLALHLGLPVAALSKSVENGIVYLHTWLDVSPNDPAITWSGTQFAVPPLKIDENLSGNFVHLLLIGEVGVALVARRKFDMLAGYGLMLGLSFVLFAAFITWQPWHSRLHLPLFVLWVPLLGVMLSRIRYRPLLAVIVVLLAMQAAPFLLRNPLHPVLSRQNILTMPRLHQYFLGNPALEETYKLIVKETIHAKCNQLGLIMPIDSWEYPLWVLSKQTSPVPFQIQAVEVNNQSQTLADSTFQPCAVLCLQCEPAASEKYTQLLGLPKLSVESNLFFVSPLE